MLTEQEGSSNMVYVTGDLHGDYSRFKRPEMKKLRAGDILLVCGDFGFIWDNSKQEQALTCCNSIGWFAGGAALQD